MRYRLVGPVRWSLSDFFHEPVSATESWLSGTAQCYPRPLLCR